jgi:hypothetical protein
MSKLITKATILYASKFNLPSAHTYAAPEEDKVESG